MNYKALLPLIAGLGIGGVALKLGIDTLQKARGAPAASVQIWGAKTDIPRGTRITDEMLVALPFPEKMTPRGSIQKKDEIVGRVPRLDAPAGLPVLEGMLLAPGDPGGVHVPPGFRAVAVRIDESSGVDFHIDPGSRVDVVGYFTLRTGSRQETIARTLIENVEVAAVGARVSAATSEGEEKGARPTRAVTLLVTPDKVPVLHLAEQKGKIKLSMRGNEDSALAASATPVTEDEVLNPDGARADKKAATAQQATGGQSSEKGGLLAWLSGKSAKAEPAPAPVVTMTSLPVVAAPAPKPGWVVHVWRGDKVEVVRFKSRDSFERLADADTPRAAAARAYPAPRSAPLPTRPPVKSAAPAGAETASPLVSSPLQPNEKEEPTDEPQEPKE